jgi:hypothetical protein
MQAGDYVKVQGWRGIAFYIYGYAKEWDEAYEEWAPNENKLVVIMVGDDRKHTVDVEDVSPLNDSEFCGDCGQIGCGHNVAEEA